MLVAQCNIARRKFSRRAEVRGIADTAIGGNCQHLLDRKLGRIPKLDTIRQVLSFVRDWVEREKFRRIVAITGGRRKFEGKPTPAWPSKSEISDGTQFTTRRY